MEHRETTQDITDITVKLAPTAGHLTAAELLLTWRAEAIGYPCRGNNWGDRFSVGDGHSPIEVYTPNFVGND